MADTILLRAGNSTGAPRLNNREIGYYEDKKCLVVGTPGGNVEMPPAGLEEEVSTMKQDMQKKLTASKVAAQNALTADADTAALVTAFNNLLAAMKNSGVMST